MPKQDIIRVECPVCHKLIRAKDGRIVPHGPDPKTGDWHCSGTDSPIGEKKPQPPLASGAS